MSERTKVSEMKIVLCSNWFYPSIGGVETVSMILAEEFTRAGAKVTVITDSEGSPDDLPNAPYALVRKPSRKTVFELARGADVLLQNMISLQTLPGLLASRKPIVVTHQSWMRKTDGTRGWQNYLKLLATRLCHNVAISTSIAESLPVKSIVIGNPFETQEFDGLRDQPRDRDIVFMGRLVSDKGCDLLLQALVQLAEIGLRPTLTVIGDGPEMPALKAYAAEHGLAGQVEFLGALRQGRGKVVARHRIMAIPSMWAEPFGIVALEGIAAGCALVASAEGGLSYAGGPCGLYFPNGDADALTAELRKLLTDPVLEAKLVAAGPEHLTKFRPDFVAGQYLSLFQSLLDQIFQ